MFMYIFIGFCIGFFFINCIVLCDVEIFLEFSKIFLGISSFLGILFGCMVVGFGVFIIFGLVCVFVFKLWRVFFLYLIRYFLKEDFEVGVKLNFL